MDDSLLAQGSRATSPHNGGRAILVQSNGVTVESSTKGHHASVNSSGARNGNKRARTNLKDAIQPQINVRPTAYPGYNNFIEP